MAQTYIQQNTAKGDDIPYTNKMYPNATIASSGCGVCSSLMVLLNSTKYKMTLEKWAKILKDRGARWGDGTDMVVVENIMKNDYGFETSHTTDIEKLKAHLKAGYKAVANVGSKGYFSSGGHFVCVSGITKDGKAIVFDPSYYASKWNKVCKGIHRAKYFTYNSVTHELYCDFSTIAADSKNYKYHLFTPTKKVRLVYSEKDINHTTPQKTEAETKKEVDTMSKTYFGIDISEHNNTVDWANVAKKVDFAILRIGWVGNNENKMDKMFAKNYEAAKRAGIKLGAYVYIYTKTPAKATEGAKWILKQIKGCKFELPIYCDMEDSSISGLGKDTLTAITVAFNKAIINGGYRAGIYANLDWFKNKLNASVKNYYTWIAHYTSGTNKYKGEYQMWQNASNGRVDGVNGNVDTNYLYEDIFEKDKTIQPVTSTPSKPATTTTKTMYVNVTKSLNVRSGAGITYSVVGSLNRGDKVTVYDTKNGWSKISKTENKWVKSSYLSTTKPTITKKPKYKTIIGKSYKLKADTTLYGKGDLSGEKYQYKKNTIVKVIKHYSETVDYVYIVANGKYRYCKVSAFI